ncbi:MAG: transcriptional regulator, MerR family [Paenibacillus sp.]|jgi:DNA-binding transcriptional MerR regulator|nr:transcriptional regulator, MerR family [Paenibacillus sp.]
MDSLISIGQLSSSIGVSIRTIRYYEEVDILKPAKTTESNYRYYGRDEIEKLQLILFLKNLGFSLQTIKAVLTEDGQASILA